MSKTVAKGINAVYLPVTSPLRSSEWYVNYLGLSLLMPVNADSTQAQLGFSNGQTIFLIRTKHQQNANYLEVGGTEQCPITIEVEEFDHVFRTLQSKGLKLDPIEDNGDCGKNFYLYDPDGNKIDMWSGWPSDTSAPSSIIGTGV
ncbi:VOC family protein [Paenibacillus antri]|uniref:VOC family protein n=1 Tax=Paenibacillus antri TaxID=2582848 RepID=A0A5R9GJ55_9BACL|nr:VOC family protein [Paenibacillus antri]TLS51615.1 VOC family protein [Paenibacillus antri]